MVVYTVVCPVAILLEGELILRVFLPGGCNSVSLAACLLRSNRYNAATMSALTLLVIYSVAIFAASLLGGWLPSLLRMSHTRTQLMMSFVAGLMLGVACYHLLPHAILTLGGDSAVDQAVWWLMIGLLFMFVLLRTFHFHQHDHGAGELNGQHDDHCIGHEHKLNYNHSGHSHSEDSLSEDRHSGHSHAAHPLSWTGIALGLSLHTLIDGIALGAAIQSDATQHAVAGLFSIGVFAAIVLHKPLDAMSITSLMVASGWSSRARALVNCSFALMCPLGALLFFWGVDHIAVDRELLVGSALAFSAGVFLCISLSDLLPEVQFHSHDRGKLTVALLLGIVLAYGIGQLEPEGAHHDGRPIEAGAHHH